MKMNDKMTWEDYCEEYDAEALYFTNKKKDMLLVVTEGTGDNLSREDLADGYVDYWNVEGYGKAEGGFVLLKAPICETNPTIFEIVKTINEQMGPEMIPKDRVFMDPEKGEELLEKFEAKEEEKILSVRGNVVKAQAKAESYLQDHPLESMSDEDLREFYQECLQKNDEAERYSVECFYYSLLSRRIFQEQEKREANLGRSQEDQQEERE